MKDEKLIHAPEGHQCEVSYCDYKAKLVKQTDDGPRYVCTIHYRSSYSTLWNDDRPEYSTEAWVAQFFHLSERLVQKNNRLNGLAQEIDAMILQREEVYRRAGKEAIDAGFKAYRGESPDE
jgi:hypothetical protein